MHLITEGEVEDVLDLAELTDAMDDATRDLGTGASSTTIRVRSSGGGIMASALAATWPHGGLAGGKLYTTKDGGFNFVVALFDLEGELLAFMQADHLTRLRTAAATGVALRHLVTAPPEVATVIGTGRLCDAHLRLLAQEHPDLEEVRIVGRRTTPLREAVDAAEDLGFAAVASNDPHVAVKDADVIVTLTRASEPLFPPDDLADDVVICALGSTKADRVEIDPEVTGRASRVIVDSLAGSRQECGDLIAAERSGVFDWHDAEELAASLVTDVDRERRGGLILFESQGLGLQDVVAGGVALRHLRPSTEG